MQTPGTEDNAAPQKVKPDNRTLSQKRRADFQEQQREYLRGLGLMQQIETDMGAVTLDTLPVIKFKTETRLKLLAKVLPDVRQVEVTGEDGGPLEHAMTVRFIDAGSGVPEQA